MNTERTARLFAEANPVSTWEDAPPPPSAAEYLAAAERSAAGPPPYREMGPRPGRRRRRAAVAAAAFASVAVVGLAAVILVRSGSGQQPARPQVVDVTGTSSCEEAQWIAGNEYSHECTLDMSDPRTSGSATWRWVVRFEGGVVGTYTGTVTISNEDGTWTGSFTGESSGSRSTFTADLTGTGAYADLMLEFVQKYNIDSQRGTITGTIHLAK